MSAAHMSIQRFAAYKMAGNLPVTTRLPLELERRKLTTPVTLKPKLAEIDNCLWR